MMCADCHRPTMRNVRARYCAECATVRKRDSMYRYTQKPSTKIERSRYADEHREAIRAYQRKYVAKRHVAGTIKTCQTLLCDGTFVLRRKSGPRKFCDQCQVAFYGERYLRRLAAQRAA